MSHSWIWQQEWFWPPGCLDSWQRNDSFCWWIRHQYSWILWLRSWQECTTGIGLNWFSTSVSSGTQIFESLLWKDLTIWPKKKLGLRLERGRILVLNTSENMLIWHDMATSMRLSCQPMWPYQLPGALKGAPKRGKAQSMPCHDLPNAKSLGGLSNSLRGNSDGGFQDSRVPFGYGSKLGTPIIGWLILN